MKKLWLGLTVFLALGFIGSGLGSLLGAKPVMESFVRLKIPTHLGTFLGIAKISGALALLLTLWRAELRRLREWVFAGFSFNMSGAVWCHLAGGDSLAQTLPPMVLLGLVLGTWFLGRTIQEREDAGVSG